MNRRGSGDEGTGSELTAGGGVEEKTLKVLSALSGTSRTGKHPLQKSLEAYRPDSPAPRPPFPSLTPPLQPHLQLGLPWVAVS